MTDFLEQLKNLNNNLQDSAKDLANSFNDNMHSAYDYVMAKFQSAEEATEDKSHEAYTSLKKYREELRADYERNTDVAEDKLHEYRQALVRKLEESNQKLEDYNNSK